MPRRYSDQDYDYIICDEHEEVQEIFFMQSGTIGIGYNLSSNLARSMNIRSRTKIKQMSFMFKGDLNYKL